MSSMLRLTIITRLRKTTRSCFLTGMIERKVTNTILISLKKLNSTKLEIDATMYKSDKIALISTLEQKPFFNKLSEECGGCWYTNDNGFEKESAGLLVDNTRYTQGLPGPRSVLTKTSFSKLELFIRYGNSIKSNRTPALLLLFLTL